MAKRQEHLMNFFCSSTGQRMLKRKMRERRRKRHRLFRNPNNWEIYLGDMVAVVRGRDKGKTGKVKAILPNRERVVVEGLNLRYRQNTEQSDTIVSRYVESPIPLHHIRLVDPDSGLPTKVEWKYRDLEGYAERVRVSTISGEIVEKPEEARPRREIHEPHEDKDTPPALAIERTWVGPWEFFTDDQKEQIIKHASATKDIKNPAKDLPELIYYNDPEVQEYIRMLPPVPYFVFASDSCAPFTYDEAPLKKLGKKKLAKLMKMGDGQREEYSDDFKRSIKGKDTFPVYLTGLQMEVDVQEKLEDLIERHLDPIYPPVEYESASDEQ